MHERIGWNTFWGGEGAWLSCVEMPRSKRKPAEPIDMDGAGPRAGHVQKQKAETAKRAKTLQRSRVAEHLVFVCKLFVMFLYLFGYTYFIASHMSAKGCLVCIWNASLLEIICWGIQFVFYQPKHLVCTYKTTWARNTILNTYFKAWSYWVHRVRKHNLVMMCLWGMISAQLCQRIAAFVLTDIRNAIDGVLDTEQLEGLASLGTDGRYENHCWRDFIKKLPEPRLCRPWGFVVPLKNKMLGCFSRTTHMFQGLPLAGELWRSWSAIYIYTVLL